jgi:heme/copper-type cytochrome/quinol oxidase subunit 3
MVADVQNVPMTPTRRHSSGTPVLPNAILGMLLFIAAETMLFAGLISAFSIGKSSVTGGVWPPPGQPRLPIESTAFNTAVLLLSGVCLIFAARYFGKELKRSRGFLLGSIFLGTFFVVFQGAEWVQLIGEGLTLQSSTHGGFFYVIVGTHAAHALVALAALGWAFFQLRGERLSKAAFGAVQIFWYFVVAVWPALYVTVYLA